MATNYYRNEEETCEPIRILNNLAHLVIMGELPDGTAIASEMPDQYSELQDDLLDKIDWAICVLKHQHLFPHDPFVAFIEAIVAIGCAGFLGLDQQALLIEVGYALSTTS